MDFLNPAIAQLRDLFLSMTPGARITAGLLLAVVVISLGTLFRQGSAGPDAYLFGGEYLPASQLDRVESAIAQAGLSGHTREGSRIRVPAGEKAAYLAAVADGGALPPNFNTLLEKALDQGGPWESRESSRKRLEIAKQRTLSEIVRAIYWVEDAVVLYDEQQPRGQRRTTQASASVSVKPMAGETLDTRRVKKLQKLVAASWAGMSAKDVAITNLGDGGDYGSDGMLEPIDDVYYQTLFALERNTKQKILEVLRDFPGVHVEVTAELDDTIEQSIRDVKPDPKTTALQTTLQTDTSKQSTGAGGGRPGPVAQGPGRQGTNGNLARNNQSETTSEKEETINVVGAVETVTRRKGFLPQEIRATVTIPRDYIVTIWKQRNPDATDAPQEEDMKLVEGKIVTNVENIVEPLLSRLTKGEDTYKQVRVVVVDSIPPTPIEPQTMASTAMAWTGRYWSTLAMLGVAMFSLLVMRSVVKSGGETPTPGSAAAASTFQLETEEDSSPEGTEEEEEANRPRLRLKKGTSLKDDLAEMVHEDPDAAAAIVRAWIGNAG